MRLIFDQVNNEQRKALLAVAKCMNVPVKVQKEPLSKIESEILHAMKNAQLASEGKYPSRPIEDLLNELED